MISQKEYGTSTRKQVNTTAAKMKEAPADEKETPAETVEGSCDGNEDVDNDDVSEDGR